ncbi:MAG TPA: ATP-binding protein [Candidatus Elarobacter sp.]|jgi:hypothetical protein
MAAPEARPAEFLRSIEVSGWRQFEDVSIAFHDRLTIITGANGAGKTTLLNLISPHFGWRVPFATVPEPARRVIEYATNVWRTITTFGKGPSETPSAVVGKLAYDEGEASILVPQTSSEHSYAIEYSERRPLRGLFIPSHRPVFVPTAVHAPRSPIPVEQAHQRYAEAVRSAWMPGSKPTASPLQILKEALLSWLPQGSTYALDFERVLADVLPEWVGFRELDARDGEIILMTATGEFTIDAVSGGIAALIDLAWQVFTFAAIAEGRFVVIIDEPENHLHPEMQRSVLYKLTRAFPRAQFIVASHAPLVVTSVRDAYVYVLSSPSGDGEGHGATGEGATEVLLRPTVVPRAGATEPARRVVHAARLEGFDRAGTANDVLRNVLGLDYTMPVWAANVLEEAVAEVARDDYRPEALERFDRRLRENDLETYSVEAMRRLRVSATIGDVPRMRSADIAWADLPEQEPPPSLGAR